MKFLKILLCCVSMGAIGIAQAQTEIDLDACQNLVMESETEYDAATYDECGFNDFQKAISYWGPIAEQNKWVNALYEIYKRHVTQPDSKTYLYKAAQLGHAKASLAIGDELFDQQKIPEAMRYYNFAVRGDLTEEEQGKITGRLAMLYADPRSSYYDIKKALPLLKKATLQRQALPNNVMGFLSLFGRDGVPQNAEEAFKYFWRAALLGCPAAEENLGFFQLAHDRKINNSTLLNEIAARTYSCDSVSETSFNTTLNHFTFTPKQCADINYYAQRLVDTSLPFTGKDECAFSAEMSSMAEFLSN